jgi:predicted transposase/invertase (TIGR01784 family)
MTVKTPESYTASILVRENPNDYNRQNKKADKQQHSRLLKRIPLHQLMDLKVDYAFKQLFGNEKNKHITVIFLNAILQKTGRNRITDISFANTETGGEYETDKQSRLDLLVVTETDERINVEIQFSDPYEMIERSIYYWSRVYANPLEVGMEYRELHPVIAINILNFDLFTQTDNFHTSYHLYEDDEQFQLTDFMEFHFIEMTKLIKAWKKEQLDPVNSVLARWLLLLGMVDHRRGKVYDEIYSELEEIAMTDESLREALGDWEELSMTQEQRLAYESRFKRIMDEEAIKAKLQRLEREVMQEKQEVENKEREIIDKEQEVMNVKQKVENEKQEVMNERREMKSEIQEMKKIKEVIGKREKMIAEKEKEVQQNADKQAMIHAARRLLANGMSANDVAACTDLPAEKIAELERDM